MTAVLPASASEPLRRFLQVARGAGLKVSAAEGIDAVRALDIIGFHDRTLLKDTLGLVLAKTPDEKVLFDEAFELYFKRDGFAQSELGAELEASPREAAGAGEFAGHALPDATAGTKNHSGPCRKIRCHIRLSRLPGRWLAPPVA